MKNKTTFMLVFLAMILSGSIFADNFYAKIEGPRFVSTDSITIYKVVLEGLNDSYIFRVKWHDIVSAEGVSSGSVLFVKAPSGKATFTIGCDVDFADPGSVDGLLHSSAELEVSADFGENKLSALFGNVEYKTNSVKSIEFVRHHLVENLSAEGWKNMLVDYAKDMAKNAPNEFELNTMRPAYRLKMNYDALEKLTDKDVEAVKKANGGTNNLNWCWNLLKPRNIFHGGPLHLEKYDFASAWRKTDVDIAKKDSIKDRFFWFIGGTYAKDFWDEWYTCWTAEVQSPKPRKEVLGKLKVDFWSLEIYLLPFLYEALKAGDETLLLIVKNREPFDYTIDKKDVMTWLEERREFFSKNISAEDGLKKALKNAECSIRFLGTDSVELEILKKWAEEIAEYYKKPVDQREKAYWYYMIGDDIRHPNEIISEILLKQSR